MTKPSLIQRLRAKGLADTLKALPNFLQGKWYRWINSSIDRKYGVDTQGIIDDMSELQAPRTLSRHGNGYEGIQVPVFRRLLRDLRIAPAEYTFVDFGSGKGRACIMAAERGFAQVIGVEFSPVLHTIAEQNVKIFQKFSEARSPVALYLQDAAEFAIPEAQLVCFFYNPFDNVVLEKIIANLERAYNKHKRPILIAYRNAVHADILDNNPILQLVEANRDYRLYQTR